mmetsp:Transcript_16684/g.23519  ORF Transcript_16684/g.23519 Transcript_16684/m.23519 type:complete len:202 (+) Transcript_16684:167-772(+)
MFKLSILLALLYSVAAFTVPSSQVRTVQRPAFAKHVVMRMSESEGESSSSEATAPAPPRGLDDIDPMELEMMDAETRKQYEKAKRAQELREQEVFMKRSTGKHKCTNCDWEYDETKGDSMMIGGMIKPGTEFAELPSNWRCPVCRASKDSFAEVVEEIPGFEVNQGYGLGGNAMTADQKNLIIFGGLGAFFLLFLAGYGLS